MPRRSSEQKNPCHALDKVFIKFSDFAKYRATQRTAGCGNVGIKMVLRGGVGFNRCVHYGIFNSRNLARRPALKQA